MSTHILLASKKGSIKSLEGRTSSESINIVRTPCNEDASGSGSDPTNMFAYKQPSNGAIKGADFNGNLVSHSYEK